MAGSNVGIDDDLTDRLNRLGQTVDRKKASQADERARAWAEIQRDAPELASWMQAVHQTFGRPKSVSVTINGRKVL